MHGLALRQVCHARPLHGSRHARPMHGSQAQMLMLLELLLEVLLEVLLELLLLLPLYVFIHVLTRVPSCNARKRMKLQEGAAYRNHLRGTFE